MHRSTARLVIAVLMASPSACRSPSVGSAAPPPPAIVQPGPPEPQPQPEPPAGAWATTIGPPGVQRAEHMVVDAEGTTHLLAPRVRKCEQVPGPCGSLVGGQPSLVAHDRRGALRAVHDVDVTRGWVEAMARLPDDRIALLGAPGLGGTINRPAPQGPATSSIDVIDPGSGEIVKTIELDLEGRPGPSKLVVTPEGDFVVGGLFEGPLRVGPHQLRSSSDEWDVFVARFDATGQPRWLVTARGHVPKRSGQDTLDALVLLSDGDVAIAGGCRGQPLRLTARRGSAEIRCGGRRRDDAYVARIGPAGELRWVRHLESTVSGSKWSGVGASPTALAEAPGGGLVVTGLFSHVIEAHAPNGSRKALGRGFTDAFVVRYDPDGALGELWQLGGPGQDGVSAAVVVGEDLWLAGVLVGTDVPRDLRPSTTFTDHDPQSLHLPSRGVLARVGLDDGSYAEVAFAAEPELLEATHEGLHVAGSFADDTASFPFGNGSATTLLRRVDPHLTYESFLWAPPWSELQPGRLLPLGARPSSTPRAPSVK